MPPKTAEPGNKDSACNWGPIPASQCDLHGATLAARWRPEPLRAQIAFHILKNKSIRGAHAHPQLLMFFDMRPDAVPTPKSDFRRSSTAAVCDGLSRVGWTRLHEKTFLVRMHTQPSLRGAQPCVSCARTPWAWLSGSHTGQISRARVETLAVAVSAELSLPDAWCL